jgi:tetratricopeptide (TPR) repeat protein
MVDDSWAPPEPVSLGKRLDSWKEIAVYLNRHVTTVRRWERQEALPVHRHLHSKLGSIYAYTKELDIWFESRRREEAGALDAPAETSARTEQLPPPPLLAALSSSVPLSGRNTEMRLLHEAWDLACRGQHQIVLVRGEAGVGKSRLTLEFARSIAKRATVLVGRCDRESLVPFAPFVTIFQWLVRTTPVQALQRRLADIDGSSELAQIAPEITKRIHLAEESLSTTPDGRRYRMFDACSEFLVVTSRDGPILLVVEDLQWADQGSLLFLRHLLRSMREASICIIATYRDSDPDCATESHALLDDLCREHAATRIALGALAEEHVRGVIQCWIGRESPGWLTSCVLKHTEGNALFVTEMLEHLDETGALARVDNVEAAVGSADFGLPHSIRELIGRRLGRLSPSTYKLLTHAAVIGREFRLAVIEPLVDVGEDAVLDAMDEAVAARIIIEEPGAPGNFSFTHTLIRETLYSSITAARRVRLHYRIAGALEQQSSSTTLRLGELAYHFGQAAVYRGQEKAVHYAVRAGDRAVAALAFEDAARYYEMALRAIDLLPGGPRSNEERLDLHLKRGRSFFCVGQWARAKSAYDAAVSLVDPRESTKRCELLVNLAETAFWLMDVPALRTYAGEAHRLAEEIGRDDLWADSLAWKSSAQVADGDVVGGIEMDREAIGKVGGIRSFGLARIPLTLYWAGRVHEAADHAVQAVECARASDDPAFLLYALQHLGLSLSGAGRYDEALQAFDEARTFGKRCGALPLLARATSMSVAPLLSVGDLNAAMARAFDARELAHRVAFEPPLVSAGIDLLLIFARLEDPGRAESLFDDTARAVRKASGWHAWKWNMRLWQARAELAFARGAWTDAIRAATTVIDQSRPRHRLKYEAMGLATRARARRRIDTREAADDARAAVDVARRLLDPAVLLDCLTVLLEIDGSDALLAEARATAHSMLSSLSQESLRSVFLASVSAKLGVTE